MLDAEEDHKPRRGSDFKAATRLTPKFWLKHLLPRMYKASQPFLFEAMAAGKTKHRSEALLENDRAVATGRRSCRRAPVRLLLWLHTPTIQKRVQR